LATRAERVQRQECALHPNDHSLAPLVRKDRELELLRVAVEGKQKENDGEKGDGSTTTRNTTTNDARSCSEPTLTEALDALFSSPPSAYPTLPCSIVGFDVGAALPPNDRHGDKRTTADGRRFMLTTSKRAPLRSEPLCIQIAVLDDIIIIRLLKTFAYK
jgi:hypothetical protein